MNANPQSDAAHGRLEALGRLVDGSPAVIFLWRIEPGHWPVEVVSSSVQGLLGYSPEDFMSERVSWPGVTHPEDAPRLEREVSDSLAAGRDEWSQQYRLIAKDGRTVWVEDCNQVLRDATGKATHIQALVMDITERKRTEQQTQFQAHLLDSIGEAVIATDAEGSVQYMNAPAEHLYGWRAGEAEGRDVTELTVPDVSRSQAEQIIARLQSGQKWTGEFVAQKRDGTRFYTMVTDSPVLDSDSKLIGIIGVSTDITERKEAEKALRESREELAEIFTMSLHLICIADINEAKFLKVNPAFTRP